MVKSYPEAVQFLYDNLPMFQRVGAPAFKKDLTNTLKLCALLGHPERKFKSIHVAGTNGKGSTSHMIASVMQQAGYKTGLYTSPHLKSFTERIRVNGQEIPEAFVVEFVNRIASAVPEIRPSFFEITVVMAFDFFAREAVDIAVVEVGLGGRLDSTNVIVPEVSVITNIGYDHKDLLGNTLPEIAFEKAGIIKSTVPVVISERQETVASVFVEKALQAQAPIHFAADEFTAVQNEDHTFTVMLSGEPYLDRLRLPLLGQYQRKNLPGVIKAFDVLHASGWALPKSTIREGLERTVTNTHLKGRWQTLCTNPLVVCDVGHNVDGMREVVHQISTVRYSRLHVVMGMVKDKELDDVLALLPKHAQYYFCEARLPRALPANILAEKASSFGLHGAVIPDVNEAKAAALKKAAPDDFIFIGGSTFVVAELNEL